MPLEKQGPIGPAGSLDSLEQRNEALTVEAHAGWSRNSARIEQGGHKVDMSGDAVNHASSGKCPGPANVTRDTDAAVVDRSLPAAQSGVEPHLGRAVIGEKDHDRVAGHALSIRGP